MAGAAPPDELIEVVVRLPRRTIEDSLLSGPNADTQPADRRLTEAKAMVAGRRRAACFAGLRFGDPAWDMILELYVATREHRPLAVSQLCSLSGCSTTTALRHIEQLERLGYVVRGIDSDDRRRAIVTMRPSLLAAAERWLDLQIAAMRMGR